MSRASRRGCRASRLREAGFTLLEVLVASVILAIGLLALGAAEITAAGATGRSRSVSVATALGDELIERIRRNRAQVASYDGFDTQNVATRPATAGTLQTDYDQWDARIEQGGTGGLAGARGVVDVTANDPIARANRVQVTISWSDGAARTVVVETVLYN